MEFLVAVIFISLAVILLVRQTNEREKPTISAQLKKGRKKSLPPEVLEKLEKAKREVDDYYEANPLTMGDIDQTLEKYNGLLLACAGAHFEERGSEFGRQWIEKHNKEITELENEIITALENDKSIKSIITPRQHAISRIYFSKLSKVELEEVKEMAGKYLPQVFPEGKL